MFTLAKTPSSPPVTTAYLSAAQSLLAIEFDIECWWLDLKAAWAITGEQCSPKSH
ncbi:hypothetical protein UPYG_G00061500 [Umbra pygmaea]|uniref:Uncharacterized protein n=1 Tax=Umbra pygmaea TaxID=75934 RepID=A0ABD0X9H0_UMBPY